MMGAQLVSRVYTSWSHLPDRPFRLLVHMALVVKDASKDPTYWAGRDAMAQALGLDPSPASHQSVKRAMRAIISSGAAEIGYHGHAGKRTEYRLTLEPKGVTQRPAEGVTQRPERGSLTDPSGGHSVTPLGTTKGIRQENREEDRLSPNSTTEGDRGRLVKADDSRLALVRSRADAEAAS